MFTCTVISSLETSFLTIFDTFLTLFDISLTDRPTNRPTDQPTDRPTRVDLEAPSPELKNRSTQSAMIQINDRWVRGAANGMVSGIVLLDLSAAFDLVSPSILHKKLEIYGLKQEFNN